MCIRVNQFDRRERVEPVAKPSAGVHIQLYRVKILPQDLTSSSFWTRLQAACELPGLA